MLNIKLLLLLHSASLSLIYPFINLHMVSLGFTRSQVTHTNIIICVLDILVPPVTGVLADNVKDLRFLIQILAAVNGGVSLCMALVGQDCLNGYLVVRILFEGSRSALLCLSEGALSLIIKKHKADYGRQRILASLGPIIVSPLTGYLLDRDSPEEQKYFNVFLIHCLLKIISIPLISSLDLPVKTKSTFVGRHFLALLRQRNIQRFLLTFGVLGAFWGLIETYLFISMSEAGASKQTLGLSQSLATATGLALQIVSGELVRRFGYDLLITVIFFIYSVRLAGYSLVVQPQHIYLCEMMRPLGHSLALTLGSHYLTVNTTGDDTATLQGLFGSVYFGVGKAVGILVGGSLAGEFGYKFTWRLFSLLSLFIGLVFFATTTKKIKTK